MTQLELMLSEDNFKLAFKRLQTAKRNLFKELYAPDLRIFGLFLNENIDSIINSISNKFYEPRSSYKIFVPKKDNLVRPITLLKFQDLLVYQAIVNIIADTLYEHISPLYNNIIFGNWYTYSDDSSAIFFYRPWKKQWSKFGSKTKQFFEQGYKFIAEFDLASFYDSIDHSILLQILKTTYEIEDEILELLKICLEKWTLDFSKDVFKRRHGIPQGPLGSAFLADVYLIHLDNEFNQHKLDIKYLRYVDDIRVFAKSKIGADKAIAYLDLLAKDMGLIPQASKIVTKEIEDIEKELKLQNSKFSTIDKEYRKKNNTLKSKTHKKLKQRFLNCFDKESDEIYLDKTLITFSLYRLNSDQEIRNIILDRYQELYAQFDAVLFYLNKYFGTDEVVLDWATQILLDDENLFHHIFALIFKHLHKLPFDNKIFQKLYQSKSRHWIVRYFMIQWLARNGKYDIISSLNETNYFIERELNFINFAILADNDAKTIRSTELMKDERVLIALQGLYLHPSFFLFYSNHDDEFNDYVNRIVNNDSQDFINYHLKRSFNIQNSKNFFNTQLWPDQDLYKELTSSFFFFFSNIEIDSSTALLNLNVFNNLVFDQICIHLNIPLTSREYGVNLNSKRIDDILPFTEEYFKKINEMRNQRTYAHPYDKDGKLRARIKFGELNQLVKKEIRALEEICNFPFN